MRLFRPLLFSFLFLTACTVLQKLQTPSYAIRIRDLEQPLQFLQRLAVGTLPLGLQSSSSNGREFTSKYFAPGPGRGVYRAASEAPTRYYAHISVLGDSRPYAIEVYVTREERVLKGNDFTYEVVGHDQRLAKELVDHLQMQLTKRREDLNIIDDFRAF
jgi:hypothetical protein